MSTTLSSAKFLFFRYGGQNYQNLLKCQLLLLSFLLKGLWEADDLWHAEKFAFCGLPAWGLRLQEGTHGLQPVHGTTAWFHNLCIVLFPSGWSWPGNVYHKSWGGAGGRRTRWKDGVRHSQSRIGLWRDQVKTQPGKTFLHSHILKWCTHIENMAEILILSTSQTKCLLLAVCWQWVGATGAQQM